MNNHDHPAQSLLQQQNQSAQQQEQGRVNKSVIGSSSSMAKRKQQFHEYSSASPPLTEDSGQWSCSFPSSPIKEQSPHGSTNHNVKSSSGSTSSCSEYNNNSRKSELYGTPHWWPIEQEEIGKKNERKVTQCNNLLLGNNPVAAGAVETKDASLESTTSSSTASGFKKPLAFTINFNDAPANDSNNESVPEEELPLPETNPSDGNPSERGETGAEPAEPISDVKSDNGTYTLDDDDSNFAQEERVSGIQLSQIDNSDWIQKWASEASAHVPDIQPIPPYDETFKILDETRSIVNAMQSRVSSDTGKKNMKQKPEHPSSIKFNKAFNIRRSLNTQTAAPTPRSYDSDNAMSRSSISDKFQAKQNFVRTDGGRFSLRIKKGLPGSMSDTEVRNIPYVLCRKSKLEWELCFFNFNIRNHVGTVDTRKFGKVVGCGCGVNKPKYEKDQKQLVYTQTASLPKPPKLLTATPSPSSRPLTTSPVRSKSILGPNSNIRPQSSVGTNGKAHTRSNSTITSRDIEMENWKRRKSYDPLKSSGMGLTNRSKADETKRKVSESSSTPTSMKLATAAAATKVPSATSLPRQMRPSLQQEPPESTASASSHHSHSPTPHDHCCGGGDYVRVHDWLQLQQQLSRNSCDQSLSPRKFEALDTLVISTIFSLSNKVRNLSLGLLKKIHPAQQDDENSALIEEMITQLSEMTSLQTDKQGQKSSSKELSGILKNVKKIEQVILVLDRVLCDQDDEESGSDC